MDGRLGAFYPYVATCQSSELFKLTTSSLNDTIVKIIGSWSSHVTEKKVDLGTF